MFIPGNEIAKFLENVSEKQIQSAGVDLTVVEIRKINESGELDFSNEKRKIPKGEKLTFDEGTPVHLDAGTYIVKYGQKMSIPNDLIGIVLPRSSLMRMGATLISALWDPGYSGIGKGLLLVTNPHGIKIHFNARIGQICFIKGKASGTYSGTYQNEV